MRLLIFILLNHSYIWQNVSCLFHPSTSSHIILLALFQIDGLFFADCCYKHTCIYIYILKYILLGLYDVNWIYVFRAIHSILDNQSACSSQKQIICPSLGIAQLPLVLCAGFSLCGLSPIHFDISIITAFIQLIVRQCY